MSLYAKTLSLAYDSAEAVKGAALKTYYRSVRLIHDGVIPNPGQHSYVTNVLLCGNCIDAETRNLYVFYIDTFYGAAWIIEINIDTRVQTVVYYDRDNAIGFDPLFKIYNARVIDGRLIWTDNNKPIYQMDVKRAKKSYLYHIGYSSSPVTEWSQYTAYGIEQIISYGRYFYKAVVGSTGESPSNNSTKWTKLCLIEDAYYSMNVENFYFAPMPPKDPPQVSYISDSSRNINNLQQTLWQFAYRYVYMDWRKSTFSPASMVAVPQAEEETATGLANEMVSLNNRLQVIASSGGEEVRQVEVVARSSQDPSKWYLVDIIDKLSEPGDENENEISGTSDAELVTMGLGVMSPEVVSVSGADALINNVGFTIPAPDILNTYIFVSQTYMSWQASDNGVGVALHGFVSMGFGEGFITEKPSWLTILYSDDSVVPLSAVDGNGDPIDGGGRNIVHGDDLRMFPATANGGGVREGNIVFQDSYGHVYTIPVAQGQLSAGIVNSVTLHAEDVSGLIIGTYQATFAYGLPTVYLTWHPVLPGLNVYDPFTVYYIIYKNGIINGNGNFVAYNDAENVGTELTMAFAPEAGDVIDVVLYHELNS